MRVRLFLGMVIASVCASGLGQTLEPLGMADYWLTCLATHDGRLFVGTSGQGVFVRDADGGQWQPLGLEGIDLRSLYPHDVGPIGWCVAAGAQPSGVGADTVLVYCWSPADSQWVPMDEGLDPQEVVAIYALDGFPDPRICGETFAGGHGGVYRRTLGGEAWERVWWRPFVEVLDLKVDLGTGTVWAVGGGTCAFTPIAAKSIDGGSTWATIFPPAPDPLLANWCLSFAFPPGSPDTVLVGMEGAVAQTTDGGRNWRFVLQSQGTRFTGLALDSANPLHVWAAGTERPGACRFWESFDGGRQWLRVGEVEEALGSAVVRLVADPSAAGSLYIATTRNGVWRYERHSAPISRDAVILTLRLQEQIPLDMALAEEIERALQAAREAAAPLRSIHAFPDYVPTELLVKVDAPWAQAWARGELWTGNQAVDALGRQFLLTGVRALFPSGQDQWWVLTFAQPLKVPLLARLYRVCQGVVAADENGYVGDGDNIEAFKKNDLWHFAFSKGWGDCPSGCIYRHYWYVMVSECLSAHLVGEWEQDYSRPIIHLWNIPPRYAATVFASVEELLQALRSPDWWVRRHALEVIGRLCAYTSPWVGEDLANQALFAALQRGVRERQGEIVALLRACLNDPDQDVRASGRLALSRALGLPGGDLACYFPLGVGNWWRFSNEAQMAVRDTLRLDGQLFFLLDGLPQLGTPAYVRFTDDNKLLLATAESSQVWLDFASTGGKWVVQAPHSGLRWTVSLQSTSDTVTVPAGTFTNCYRFFFDFGCCDNSWAEWYAPGVGPVKRTLFGFAVVDHLLESASISGVEVPTGSGVPPTALPTEFSLLPPQPNPFTQATLFTYDLPSAGEVKLTIYDLRGRNVRTLDAGRRSVGRHHVTWDGKDDRGRLLPSGQYLCVLTGRGCRTVQKVTLLR